MSDAEINENGEKNDFWVKKISVFIKCRLELLATLFSLLKGTHEM